MTTQDGPRFLASWITAACWLTLAGSGGCSFLGRLSPEQCSTDRDCANRGAAFAGYVCRQGTCVEPSTDSSPEDAATSSSWTEASSDSIEAKPDATAPDASLMPEADASTQPNNGPDAMADAGQDASADTSAPNIKRCQKSADCVPEDPTRTQVACDVATGTCVQLTTADCPLVIGDYSGKQNAPLFVGAFATFPEAAPKSHPSYLNYKLAIDEFSTPGGISGWDLQKGAPGLRIPVAVVCNSLGDVQKAMKHLTDTVRVPAVVAALDSKTLRTSFVTDAYPKKVFVINVFGADSTLMSLTTDGLLWHMLGQPRDNAPAYEAFLPRVEAYVRKQQKLEEPVRLAVVTAKATVTNDLEAAALGVMRWNNASAKENEDNGFFRRFTLDSVLSEVAIGDIDITEVAGALLDYRPHIVVSFASAEFIKLLQYVEIKWGDANPRPFYLIGPYNMESQDLLSWARDAERQTRIAGIAFASTSDRHALDSYTSRFLSAYINGESALGRENYYDAMYFAIYSIVAAGKFSTLQGTDLAQGMLRLLSGKRFETGPSDMGDISGALGAPNGTVSLVGTLGAPNFARNTGARIGEGSVYCISRSSGANAFAFDVLRLAPSEDGGAQALSGAFSCYDGP